MKKPPTKDGKATMEKAKAGAHKPSGINKMATDMKPAKVPQRVAKTTYGMKSQTQKS